MKINDYKDFKEFLKSLNGKKPTLLLHSCCGPCSTSVLKRLVEYFDITILYYNPNIYPIEEFDKRLDEQKKFIEMMNYDIKIISVKEPHDVYLDAVKDYASLPEGSMRCYKCYEFRLKYLSDYANNHNYDFFTTVMSVSPYKNSDWINEIGYRMEGKSHFLYSNFKKEEGYKDSIRISNEMGLYRQDYCGCEFSLAEHEERLK